MDISDKRTEIAECIVVLKKGLKHLRRDDVDRVIQLLLDYDRDLKRMGKVLKPSPIQKQGSDEITYDKDYQEVQSERSVQMIKAVVINDSKQSIAYPLRETAERTVSLINQKQLAPIAPVIIDPWMKEHYEHEVPFIKIYATIVNGHIETAMENVISVGCQVEFVGGDNKIYEVFKMDNKRVWIKRGFLSFLPVKKNKLNPIKQTEVKYFKIDNWPQ